jgi:hypothetical protein
LGVTAKIVTADSGHLWSPWAGVSTGSRTYVVNLYPGTVSILDAE